jgi:hypothetical protein
MYSPCSPLCEGEKCEVRSHVDARFPGRNRESRKPCRLPGCDPDLERRHERADEIELTDGANILTEARAAEERVHSEGGYEITQEDPGGEVRAIQEVERLIGPEEQDEQAHGEPLAA